MHVPPDRQRAQHVEMPRGQPRQPEERQPRRQIDEPGLLPQPRTRALNPLRRIRNPDPRAQPPPELRLPHAVRRGTPVPSSPRAQARTISGRCSAYRSNSSARCRTALNRRARRAGSTSSPDPPEMRGQARQPRLPQTPIHHLEQSPNRPLRQPRIRIRLDPRRRRHRIPDEPPRRREVDVRAHPIAPPIPRPEPIRHPLREPPLHAARRARRRPRARTGRAADRPSSARSASTRPSARSARWTWSTVRRVCLAQRAIRSPRSCLPRAIVGSTKAGVVYPNRRPHRDRWLPRTTSRDTRQPERARSRPFSSSVARAASWSRWRFAIARSPKQGVGRVPDHGVGNSETRRASAPGENWTTCAG